MDNQISVNVRRAFIETNLEACKKSIAMSLYQIGTLLCQAKDEGVVPHGEWTAWATAHSGLNERGVQYAMRQARELTADSPLLSLDDSKINALLRIPAGEREEFAERIDAKSASSREVADAVAQYRRERDEALRLVGEQKKRLNQMESEKKAAVEEAMQRTYKERREQVLALESTLARERKQRDSVEQALKAQADTLRMKMLKSESERMALSDQLQQAKAGGGISLEAQAEIEKLKAQMEEMNSKRAQSETELRRLSDLNERLENAIAKKEEEIDRMTDALDAARTEAARGVLSGGGERSPVTSILAAIGALMAEAGRAPGDLAHLASPMDAETRALLTGQAQLLGQWAMQVIAACGGDCA